MTTTLTPEREAQIKKEAGDLYRQRVREAGLAGRALNTLTVAEEQAVGRALIESERLAAQLRGGVGLLDLGPHVPIVDGAAPMIGDLAAAGGLEMTPLRESDVADGPLLDLGPGVPVADDAVAARATLDRLRESDAVAGVESLIDLPGVPMREASFGGENGTPEVLYEDQELRDLVHDLYSILDENRDTGSPSLENSQVLAMVEAVGRNQSLSTVQIGLLKGLLVKYAAPIKALRESPDREGQDYRISSVPDPETARLVTDGDRGAGLLDLGEGVPKKAPVAA